MRLSHLLPTIDPGPDPEITQICEDSRKAGPGTLFVAQKGHHQSGTAHLHDAISRGAVALVVPEGTALPSDIDGATIPVIQSDHPRHLVGALAARLYPRQPDHMAAVTGTSGKTSTVWFAQQILSALGHPSCSLGTLGIQGKITESGSLTTPEAPHLHQILDRLAGAGVTHLVMEASSQGLAQHRLDHVRLRAAGFTNLSRDHLDYHGTLESYFSAKTRLFSELLPEGGVAVLNADSDGTPDLARALKNRGITTWTYGKTGDSLRLAHQDPTSSGQDLSLEIFGKSVHIFLPVAGAFQVGNALCALGLALALTGLENLDRALDAVARLTAPPGRLEFLPGHPSGAAIYIDYAHKPDALQQVLRALRPHTSGRLVCLLGCGGDRDAGKRPLMGKIAHDLADRVIVTDDNPRSEDPAAIRAAIREACPGSLEIADRRAAIRTAIADLKTGDTLVIAGKGHESGQIFANHTIPFSDREEAATAIASLPPFPPAEPAR